MFLEEVILISCAVLMFYNCYAFCNKKPDVKADHIDIIVKNEALLACCIKLKYNWHEQIKMMN